MVGPTGQQGVQPVQAGVHARARASLAAQYTQAASLQASPTRSAAAPAQQGGAAAHSPQGGPAAAAAQGGKRQGPQAASPGHGKVRRITPVVPQAQPAVQAAISRIKRAAGKRAPSAARLAHVRSAMVKAAAAAGRKGVQPSDLLLYNDGRIRETSTGPSGQKMVLQEWLVR